MIGATVTLTVNGRDRIIAVPVDETLLVTLRERLGLTGAKLGCNQGVCGACTVLVDGRPVRGCLALSINCEGAAITTIEGLGEGRSLSLLQQAFVAAGAVQCGFCTSGMLLAATALLAEKPAASVEEIRAGLAGNICRCTGYRKIIDAVLAVATGRGP
ncbi:MAG TPA: (2Fe-2S)-binding protein [Alphaproteobacteria bacterium]|nr:(2Fe-2S)-binding protein [Alphaproteobacteria bacterium]